MVFSLSGFSFTGTDDSQDSRGREETIFYSTLPLPPAHEHWDIYLQFCMWDDYHVFLIASLCLLGCYSMRFTTLSNYHLIDWLMMQCLYVYLMNWFKVLVTAILTWETSGFELASTITLALQVNRLTKCAIHSCLRIQLKVGWLNLTMPNQTVRNDLKAKKMKLPQMIFLSKNN